MNFYRFSISWPRVLPTGDISNINEMGIGYYSEIIDELLENGIEPMITMYHWDLPQALQLLGGFTNSRIITYFKDYATLLFERFGDRVKYWITFNEPNIFCPEGYGSARHAPGINANGVGEYFCGHNVLKAHAIVYHTYRKQFHKRIQGKVGISITSRFFYSETNSSSDVYRAMQFEVCLGVVSTANFKLSDFILPQKNNKQ